MIRCDDLLVGEAKVSGYPAEQELRASVRAGVKVCLGGGDPGGRSKDWPSNRVIRAEVLAALLVPGRRSSGGRAALWVEGACIIGRLDLRRTRIEIPLIMRQCYFSEGVDLSEARVVSVSLSGSHVPSLRGYGLQIGADLDCSDCEGGQFDIFGARIGGRLWLSGAALSATGDRVALDAPDLEVTGGMYCRGLRAVGGVNLFGATIGSTLEFDGAVLSSQSGPALRAPGLCVGSDLSCTGCSATGAVEMFGAQIGGQVWLNNARLDHGTSVCALDAPQIRVGGGLYCNGRFNASGVINLFGAAIGATVEFSGATLSSTGGPCLRAHGLTAGSSVVLDGGFAATGRIDLAACRITGDLKLAKTAFTDGALDLRGAGIGGLNAEPECLPARLHLNGLTYATLQPYLPATQRLPILLRDEDGYQPQPYEQLASYYRTLGYVEQARAVLLAKQRRRRRSLSPPARIWDHLQEIAIGYGYKPARALLWLTILIGVTAAYLTAYPPHHPGGSPGLRFHPIIDAFYVVVPILNIGQPNPYPVNAVGQWVVWIAQLAGWLLATIIAVSMTRLVSRD